jgi:hypothetical protein
MIAERRKVGRAQSFEEPAEVMATWYVQNWTALSARKIGCVSLPWSAVLIFFLCVGSPPQVK